MEESLSYLFGEIKAKLLKIFFLREGVSLSQKFIFKKIPVSPKKVKKEINDLLETGLLKKERRKKDTFFSLNHKSPFFAEIKAIVFKAGPLFLKEILKVLKNQKQIKLALISGIFLDEKRSPVDLLLVGNSTQKKIESLIKRIEKNIGREIKWSYFSVEEYKYRKEMGDHFLKEIFELPNKILFDKIK
jgi:hypothetical protein